MVSKVLSTEMSNAFLLKKGTEKKLTKTGGGAMAFRLKSKGSPITCNSHREVAGLSYLLSITALPSLPPKEGGN